MFIHILAQSWCFLCKTQNSGLDLEKSKVFFNCAVGGWKFDLLDLRNFARQYFEKIDSVPEPDNQHSSTEKLATESKPPACLYARKSFTADFVCVAVHDFRHSAVPSGERWQFYLQMACYVLHSKNIV